MRRHGDLWRFVVDPENIELAYKRAKHGKTWQRTIQRVERRKEAALSELHSSLINHTFTTSEYRTKQVHEPKERTIYILPFFPDRIAQHAVMNFVAPIWNRMFDEGSHACRPGKGQHSASRDTMRHVRRYRYVLQGDIRKFYPSIHHDTALSIIRRKIKDPDVLWLLEDIIRSFPGDRNVPIGNLTSQWLGNLYMNEFDQWVRRELRPGGYVRYNDDFLLFGNDRRRLISDQERCREHLDDALKLTMSKDRVYPVSRGVDFVGYRHFPEYVLVRKSTAKRIAARLRRLRYELATGIISLEKARSVVASIGGWMRWSSTYNFRRSLRIDALQEDIVAAIS
jgi:RNA-directed DNA polymerase